jgi:hypothetical protein
MMLCGKSFATYSVEGQVVYIDIAQGETLLYADIEIDLARQKIQDCGLLGGPVYTCPLNGDVPIPGGLTATIANIQIVGMGQVQFFRFNVSAPSGLAVGTISGSVSWFEVLTVSGLNICTGGCTVRFRVAPPPNTAPSISNRSYATNEDIPSTVLPPITDPDAGDTHTYIINSQPANGSAALFGGGIRYTPPVNWSGTTSFMYSVKDQLNATSTTRTITFTVNPINDQPVATNATYSTNEDTLIDVEPNYTDIDPGDSHVYLVKTQPVNGSASIVNGKIRFTPAANWNGTTSFQYAVRDNGGIESTNKIVTVTVTPVNDAPWANNASYTTNEDTALLVSPPKGDIDGDSTIYLIKTQPANGSVTMSSGQIRYTPPSNWNGTTTFTYVSRDTSSVESPIRTITFTVNPVNDAPWSNNASYTLNEDTTHLAAPPKGDIDGDVTTYVIKSQPANGSVVISGAAMLFTPNVNWNGATSYTFASRDTSGVESPVRTVSLTINPVNDMPVVPNATVSLIEDTSKDFEPTISDVDVGDTHVYVVVTQPGNGNVTVGVVNGKIRVTTSNNWNGTTSFTYAARDSGNLQSTSKTLTVIVTPANDVPGTVNSSHTLNEDSLYDYAPVITDPDAGDTHTYVIVAQPLNGSTSITSGNIRFSPDPNWFGTTSLTFLVRDNVGAESAVRTLSYTVNPVNDQPSVTNVSRTIDEDTTDTFSPAITDPDLSDTHTYTIKSQPANGTASIVSNQVRFVPDPDFTGTTTFNYSVTDNQGSESIQKSITYTVQPVSDPPVSSNIIVEIDEGGAVTIPAVYSDPDTGDTHTAIRTSVPTQGNATIISAPVGFYFDMAGSNWNGTVNFKYRIVDNNGVQSNESNITVKVNPVNDAPSTAAASLTVAEDTPGTVTAGITDPDLADTHTLEVTQPANGAVVISGLDMTFTPVADWNGVTTFTYRAQDSAGAYSSYSTVTVTVNASGDAPTTNNLTLTIDEDTVGQLTPTIFDPDVGDTQVLSIQLPPVQGTVSIAGLTMEYTPPLNWNGNTFFTYRVTDSDGLSATASVNVTVNPVNDAPTSSNKSVTGSEDIPFDIAAVYSDVDAGDTHLATVVTPSPNGSVSVTGTIMRFTPTLDWNGTTTFTYRVSDQDLAFSNESTITVTITPDNDAPSTSNMSVITDEDSPIAITPVIFDPDAGDTYSLIVVATPGSGLVTIAGGVFTYTPSLNWYGDTSFTFRAVDNGAVSSNTSAVTITVNPVNDVPVVGDLSITIDEDNSATFGALITDVDPPDTHTITIISAPAVGTVSMAGTAMTYTPDANWFGTTTYTYTVTDSAGAESNVGTVTINGNGINDAPVVPNESSITTDEDTPAEFSPPITDPDIGDTHTIELLSFPDPGQATVTIDGLTIDYVPASNWNGVHTILYRVLDNSNAVSNTGMLTVTVTPVNDAPAVNNLSIEVDEDNAGSAISTITDPDIGDTHTLAIMQSSAFGTATISANEITFTPNDNWYGVTTIGYQATDSAGAKSNLASLSITVNPVNDLPSLMDESLATNEDKPAVYTPTITDYDPGDSHYTVIMSPPDFGDAVAIGDQIQYTPPANWNGVTTLTFKVVDTANADSNVATLTITVDGVNDMPEIVDQYMTVNEDISGTITVPVIDVDIDDTHTVIVDSGPANGVVSIDGVDITYNPNLNFNGADSLTFHVVDQVGAPSQVVTLYITINSVNDNPIVYPLSLVLDEDMSAAVDGIVTDVDDGDTHTFTLLVSPPNGTVTLDGATFSYTPNQDWNGSETFTYRAQDNGGKFSAPQAITVTVNPINDTPTTANLTILVDEDETAVFNLVLIDPDIGDNHTVSVIQDVANGTAGIVGTQVAYQAAANWFGTDTLTYRIVDSAGAQSNVGEVTIIVASIYDAPVAPSELEYMDEDGTLAIPITITDGDLPDDAHALFLVSSPSNGNVSIDGLTFVYSPNADWNGTETFSYHALDSNGLYSNTATVTIEVFPVNDDPVISDISVTTDEDTPIVIPPIIAEVDLDNTHTLLIISQPDMGIVEVVSGSYVYTPPENWFGSTSFNYRVYDQDGAYSGTSTISIDVTSVDDPPVITPLDFDLLEDNSQMRSVVITDVDPGETHTLAVLTQPTGGAITQSGFDLTFTPDEHWNGDTSFTIQATDDKGLVSQVYTVLIYVEPVNDTPSGTDNTLTTDEDIPATMAMVVIDPDVTDSHTLLFIDVPGDGIFESNATMITYTPTLNWYGDTYITYRIVDSAGAESEIYRLDIQVNSVNDAPVANSMSFAMDEDGTQTLTAPISDVDIGDMLTVELVAIPSYGTLTVNGYEITYTPDPDWFGFETLSYQARDLEGAVSNIGVINVEVYSINDVPAINNGALIMNEDSVNTYTVTVTDIDILTGDSHNIVIEIPPENGTISVDGLGITFTPDLNWFGETSMALHVTDLAGADSNSATVMITVDPVNDNPESMNYYFTIEVGEELTTAIDVIDVDNLTGHTLEIVSMSSGILEIDALNFNYKPPFNWWGVSSYRFRVHDIDGGQSVLYNYVITVNEPPNNPNEVMTVSSGTIEAFPVDQQLYNKDDQPITVIETDIIIIDNEPAEGLANYTFTLDVNSDFSVRVEDQLVNPGDSIDLIYDFDLNEGRVSIPIYPGQAGLLGQASYTIDFANAVDWVQMFQFTGYKAWSDQSYAQSCFEYLVPPQGDMYYLGPVGSGVYRIHPSTAPQPFDVYCDMQTDGGGWTVIQKRNAGTGDFNQPWNDYVNGFYELTADHWLGLEKLNWITMNQGQQLMITMLHNNGSLAYERYSSITVGDSGSNYVLSVGGSSGSAGDSLSSHSGHPFSANDRDNDSSALNCAQEFVSGWWFHDCMESNLNGLQNPGPINAITNRAIIWDGMTGDNTSLEQTWMMVRPDNAGSVLSP